MNVESGWGLNESSFAGSQLLTSTPLGPEYSPPPPPPPPKRTNIKSPQALLLLSAGTDPGNQSLSGSEELGSSLRVS